MNKNNPTNYDIIIVFGWQITLYKLVKQWSIGQIFMYIMNNLAIFI